MQVGWTRICSIADFPGEGKLSLRVGEWQVLVIKGDDQFFAYNDCCPHQAARLSGGRIRRGSLMCPLHGARFEISTGRCMGGSYAPLLAMPVRDHDGFIEVDIPSRAPAPEEMPV
jgi:3-phenylpropionate/trans-cinnamate dioxygenase ferredoxin subunit